MNMMNLEIFTPTSCFLDHHVCPLYVTFKFTVSFKVINSKTKLLALLKKFCRIFCLYSSIEIKEIVNEMNKNNWISKLKVLVFKLV